jgi:hypothetical protein
LASPGEAEDELYAFNKPRLLIDPPIVEPSAEMDWPTVVSPEPEILWPRLAEVLEAPTEEEELRSPELLMELAIE